jgi:hypothetical protein
MENLKQVHTLKLYILKLKKDNLELKKENERYKKVLNKVRDILDFDDINDINENLDKKRNKYPKFQKNNIILYTHPKIITPIKAKVLSVYTNDPKCYYYDVLLENGHMKQTIENYLMFIKG